jgi:arylsulfatase A-like enzyme
MSQLSRRNFLTTLGVATATSLVPGLARAATKSKQHPNIVFILADDLGYGDVQCMNPEGKIPTPNINRLAAEGMKFTDAHSGSAVCTPTRYGILTGRYAWRTSLKNGVTWGYSPLLIEKNRLTVPALLKKNGYRTAGVGKWHLGLGWTTNDGKKAEEGNVDFSKPMKAGPLTVGFDSYYGIPASLDMDPYVYIENDRVEEVPTQYIGMRTDPAFFRKGPIAAGFHHSEVLPRLTDKAVGCIEEHARQDSDKPLFLYFPLTAPHVPLLPTKEFRGKSRVGIWGDFVCQVDWTVGEVTKALERSGMAENTLVIVTSDNGATPKANFPDLAKHGHNPSANLRGFKADIYEGGHRVPFIAKWPGKIKPASQSRQTICLTDLLATCAALVDEKLPKDAGEDSYNILPALLGKQGESPIREATVHHSINGSFSIRQGKWKLELCPGSGGWSDPRPEHTRAMNLPPIQLYDLETDLGERDNVYKEHPKVVERLTGLLEQYMKTGRSTPA